MPNSDALLAAADGRVIRLGGEEVTPRTAGFEVLETPPDWRARILAFLADPNLAYILMLVGIYGIIFEFVSPGALVPGIVGAISLVVARPRRDAVGAPTSLMPTFRSFSTGRPTRRKSRSPMSRSSRRRCSSATSRPSSISRATRVRRSSSLSRSTFCATSARLRRLAANGSKADRDAKLGRPDLRCSHPGGSRRCCDNSSALAAAVTEFIEAVRRRPHMGEGGGGRLAKSPFS